MLAPLPNNHMRGAPNAWEMNYDNSKYMGFENQYEKLMFKLIQKVQTQSVAKQGLNISWGEFRGGAILGRVGIKNAGLVGYKQH